MVETCLYLAPSLSEVDEHSYSGTCPSLIEGWAGTCPSLIEGWVVGPWVACGNGAGGVLGDGDGLLLFVPLLVPQQCK